MKIEFDQTAEHLENFYIFNFWLSPERKDFRWKKRALWGLLAATPIWLILINNESENINYWGVFVFGLFLFALGYIIAGRATVEYWKGAVKRLLSQKINSDLLGHVVLDFQPDKIFWKGALQEGVSGYEVIKKIMQDSKYYYLYHNSVTAWVIPKSVIASEELRQFEKLLEQSKIRMHQTDFIARLTYKTSNEGGRKTPAFSGYRPLVKFSFSEMQTSGQQIFINKDVVHPGDSVDAAIRIIGVDYFANQLEDGMHFDFREGSRIIGTGVIKEVVNPKLKRSNF